MQIDAIGEAGTHKLKYTRNTGFLPGGKHCDVTGEVPMRVTAAWESLTAL